MYSTYRLSALILWILIFSSITLHALELTNDFLNDSTIDIGQWIKDAKKALKEENTLEALGIYKSILFFDATNEEAISSLMDGYVAYENYEALIDTGEAFLKQNPYHTDVMLYVGIAYLSLNKIKEAMTYFNGVIEIESINPFAYFYLSRTYYLEGNLHEALASLQRAVILSNKNYDLQIQIGLLYNEMGNNSQALYHFQKAVNMDSKRHEAYLGAAYCYYDLKNVDRAISMARRAVDRDNKSLDAYLFLAQVYLEMNNFAETFKYYSLGMATNPDSLMVYVKAFYFLLEFERYGSAERLLSAIEEYNPKSALLIGARGALFYRTGRYRDAVHQYNQALALDPIQGSIYYLRARAYTALKDFAKAEKDLIKSINFNSAQKSDFILGLGYLYLKMRDYNKAYAVILSQLELSESPVLWWLMSAYFVNIGDIKQGYHYIGYALKADYHRELHLKGDFLEEELFKPIHRDDQFQAMLYNHFTKLSDENYAIEWFEF